LGGRTFPFLLVWHFLLSLTSGGKKVKATLKEKNEISTPAGLQANDIFSLVAVDILYLSFSFSF